MRKIRLVQKAGRFLLVFAVIFGWIFGGWPQIRFPITPIATPEGAILTSISFPQSPRVAVAATTTVIIDAANNPPAGYECTGAPPDCFKIPSDWDNNANRIEVIGGGSGGVNGAANGSGGGGGGAYSSGENITLTAGVEVTFAVGAGGAESVAGTDTFICSAVDGVNCAAITGSVVVMGAKAGTLPGGNGSGSAAGGDSTAGVATGANQIKYSGGASGAGDTDGDNGGGGGGAAGPGGIGAAGESTGGTTGIDGGGGGAGGGDGAGNAGEAGGTDGKGQGGDGSGGTGGGVTAGQAATAATGGGGAGNDTTGTGGAGATLDVAAWGAGYGPGGGGGGSGNAGFGGAAGAYGGGGGGGENGGGQGGGGIIVISYTPSLNNPPTVDSVALDRTTITLNENTFVWASTTITITDTNGCSEITSVTAQLAAASTTAPADGSTCEYNGNICYTPTNAQGCVATTTGNTCSDGTPNTGEWDCGFQLWYNAFPTDSSAPIPDPALQYWYVSATTSDASETDTATNTAQTVDVATLNALDVTGTIAYPETAPSADTGTTDQTVTITNTGNTALDNEISGDVMCTDYATCAGNSFTQDQQKFDLTAAVDYLSKTYTLAATSSPATIETDLATTSATTTAVTINTYWGIAIPNGQPAGDYTGQNTFGAVAD